METSKGKQMATAIGAWLVIKGLLNLILGFSLGNLLTLVISVVLAALLIIGTPYLNYITAGITAIVVLVNLPYNLSHFQIIYLLEAVIDIIAIVLLVSNADLKKHFESDGE
ncbi:MAG: hypothetical protein ACI4D8_02505 [Wujia sp.]